MVKWFKIQVAITDEIEEAVVNFLFELECSGCEQSGSHVMGYFSSEKSKQQLRQKIEKYLIELSVLNFQVINEKILVEDVEEQDWHAEWKKRLKPLVISERFVVKPSWEKYTGSDTDAIVIEIDPKQAFGTGTHATTQIMIRLLEKHLQKNDRVLDIGTGTGILAIAAIKLGAERVVAVDIDPIAIEAAQENLAKNSADTNVHLFAGELSAISPNSRFDLMLANINKNAILRLLEEMIALLKPNAQLIISGILLEENKEIIEKIEACPQLKVSEEIGQEEWLGLVFKKVKSR